MPIPISCIKLSKRQKVQCPVYFIRNWHFNFYKLYSYKLYSEAGRNEPLLLLTINFKLIWIANWIRLQIYHKILCVHAISTKASRVVNFKLWDKLDYFLRNIFIFMHLQGISCILILLLNEIFPKKCQRISKPSRLSSWNP